MAKVEISNLTKRFGAVEVLHGIDISVPDGAFLVMVGPSGCGKSTLLRMVAGLEPISGGTVAIGGRVVNGVPPKSRDIAMVFQNYALYPHMSVVENMSCSLRLRRAAPEEIRPKHFVLETTSEQATLDLEVKVVEPTGAETMVIGHCGSEPITAVFRERHALSPGERIRLRPSVIHVFDEQTERRISA